MYKLYLLNGGEDYAVIEHGDSLDRAPNVTYDFVGAFSTLREAFDTARIHCPWCFKKRMKRGA